MKKNLRAKRFCNEGKFLFKYLIIDFIKKNNSIFEYMVFHKKLTFTPPHFHIMQQNCNNSP
jgi:hypothetical protein